MKLPVLKPLKTKLPDLSGKLPRIIVDTREQSPLVFTRLASEVAGLTTGDYSFSGGETFMAVERKSVADLVGCCMGVDRARFERELHRLRGFQFKRLLVVGRQEEIEAHQYRSRIDPEAVLNTLAALEVRYEVPVVFADTPADGAWWVEQWACWCAREIVTQANHLARRMADTEQF
jgi:DNA excision repair protein ERCC-4